MGWRDSSLIKSSYWYSGVVPSTHTRQFATARSSSFFLSKSHWPPQAPGTYACATQKPMQTRAHLIKYVFIFLDVIVLHNKC